MITVYSNTTLPQCLSLSFDRKNNFKPEVHTNLHENYIFSEPDCHADYKNILCFRIGPKLRNFAKICKFCKFRSAALNTE